MASGTATVTSSSGLNVRKGPSTSYAKLGALSVGDEVQQHHGVYLEAVDVRDPGDDVRRRNDILVFGVGPCDGEQRFERSQRPFDVLWQDWSSLLQRRRVVFR